MRNLEGKMSEARDMMAAPGGSAPLHQRIDSMQVGCLPLVTMVTDIIEMCILQCFS